MPLKKIISLGFLCLFLQIFEGWAYAACDPSPEIKCISVAGNGEITISWQNPSPLLNFNKHYIYCSSSLNGPYSVVDSIFNSAITTYTHTGSNGNAAQLYYYMKSNCGGSLDTAAVDTVSSILMKVVNPGNGTAQLSWNSLHTPALTTSMGWYRIFREYPAGTWTLIDSTQSLTYMDTITICRSQLNYRVEIGDNTGCVSVSSAAGNLFSNMIVPAVPLLDSVSVDISGKAVLGWKPSSSKDTEGYIIYQMISGIWQSIDTVYGINTTFFNNVNSLAGSTIENYRIAAFDSCKNTSPMGVPHNTILVKSTPNACARLNTLNWNAYTNMSSGIGQYDIYVSTNGGAYAFLGTTPSSTTSYVHTNLQPTFVYCYIVIARDVSGTRSSTSNKYCYTANIPAMPTFSYLKTATVASSNSVKVYCYVDIAAEISKYKVFRSESPSGPFKLIGGIPFTGSPIVSYTDNTAKTTEKSYYYKTVAVDTCGNDTTVTNLGRTILLTAVANDDLTNTLTWNDYESWLGSVNSYNVYRAVDGVWDATPIGNVIYTASGTNTFTDDISPFFKGEGQFSYYVNALEDAGNPYGINDSSRSNVADALQDAKVFIPNTFIPSGRNNVFIPVTSYINKTEYDFRIFDRWGEQVFQTSDPYEPWDGTIGGKKGPEDMYVYLLKFKTAYGQYIERKGVVTLLR